MHVQILPCVNKEALQSVALLTRMKVVKIVMCMTILTKNIALVVKPAWMVMMWTVMVSSVVPMWRPLPLLAVSQCCYCYHNYCYLLVNSNYWSPFPYYSITTTIKGVGGGGGLQINSINIIIMFLNIIIIY